MKTLKNEWLQILLLAAPFCVAALLWDKLPERMPIHWNLHGQVDGYGSRTFGALFLPCFSFFVVGLVWLCSRVDPRIRAQSPETRASSIRVFRAIRLVISMFFTIISLTTVCIAVGMHIDISRAIAITVALMFLLLGNLMGKLRPNYFAGIRTPWSLESPEVWQKTHRLAGKVMVGGSLLLLVGAITLPTKVTVWFMLLMILTMTLVPALYSYFIYKKQQPV